MAIIKKKTWPEEFGEVLSGKKRYDLRLNDFAIQEGDALVLEEWDPNTKQYTGRSIEKKVLYVGTFDPAKTYWPQEEILEKGLQIISIE